MYVLLFVKMKLSGGIILEAEKLKKTMVIEGVEYEDWSEQEVRNIIFNGSTIKQCGFDGVFFTELGLNDSQFRYTGFDRAEFAEVGMHDASFTMVGITNAKFNSGTIYGSTFDGTFANNVRFNQVQLENTVIRESNLSEAVLDHCKSSLMRFEHCDFRQLIATGGKIETRMEGVDLSNSIFDNCNIDGLIINGIRIKDLISSSQDSKPIDSSRDGQSAPNNIMASLLPSGRILTKQTDEGLVLTGARDNHYMYAAKPYRTPVTIETVAKTDSTNLRLKYGNGAITFNWEMNKDELVVHHPVTGEHIGFAMQGRIPRNELVHVTWTIEKDRMSLSLNGKQRCVIEGDFGSLCEPIGIGPAWGSIVTVQSFAVSGEEGDQPIRVSNDPAYFWDCAYIMMPGDRMIEAIEWYSKHLGWEFGQHYMSPVGLKADFSLPGGGHVSLKQLQSEYEHLQPYEQAVGHDRLQFAIGNPIATRTYFEKEGIPVSETRTTADGNQCFDITAFGDVRLTCVHQPELDGKYPKARLIQYADVPLRFCVTDLSKAVNWYVEHLLLTEIESNEKGVLLAGKKGTDTALEGVVYLETVLERCPEPSNHAVRPYFAVSKDDFDLLYTVLKEKGIAVSPVAGDINRWAGFHFHDPDGNRINAYTQS